MDEKDRTIIAILQKDGRAKLSEIAKQVGITVMGVKKRVEKLYKSKIIKSKALVNTRKLNIMTAIILMELKNAKSLEKIIKKFEKCPRIIKFFVTTGRFNLFALVFAEDYHSLESISLEKCSLRNQEGVMRFEFYPIQEIHYDPFLDIKVTPNKNRDIAPCGVYCGTCNRYKDYRCLGCPATKFYRGNL